MNHEYLMPSLRWFCFTCMYACHKLKFMSNYLTSSFANVRVVFRKTWTHLNKWHFAVPGVSSWRISNQSINHLFQEASHIYSWSLLVESWIPLVSMLTDTSLWHCFCIIFLNLYRKTMQKLFLHHWAKLNLLVCMIIHTNGRQLYFECERHNDGPDGPSLPSLVYYYHIHLHDIQICVSQTLLIWKCKKGYFVTVAQVSWEMGLLYVLYS